MYQGLSLTVMAQGGETKLINKSVSACKSAFQNSLYDIRLNNLARILAKVLTNCQVESWKLEKQWSTLYRYSRTSLPK